MLRVSDDDLIAGPRWRTRTSPERRHRLALVTFGAVLIPGVLLMIAAMWLLDRVGAPAWVVALPWLVPTVGVCGWAAWWPSPAAPNDDTEQTWAGFAIRYVLVGESEPRPRSLRVLAALAFGGPVGWSVLVVAGLAIAGLA